MNIINAIINLVNNPVTELTDVRNGNNRANNAGEGLEIYVRNLFAGTFGVDDRTRRNIWNRVFSLVEGNGKPPDMMLRGGDAIEVKKIETPTAPLALNSSYPKQRIYADRTVSVACRDAEIWDVKDIIYVTGLVRKNTTTLHKLCMVYGLDYCASREVYENLKRLIKRGVESSPGIAFTPTDELGHVNNIDPLGITYMRARPMYGIDNPWTVFNDFVPRGNRHKFEFLAIIDMQKWDEFDNTDDLIDLTDDHEDLIIYQDEVPDPDNPEETREVMVITYGHNIAL